MQAYASTQRFPASVRLPDLTSWALPCIFLTAERRFYMVPSWLMPNGSLEKKKRERNKCRDPL
jgi:hypothetical protein